MLQPGPWEQSCRDDVIHKRPLASIQELCSFQKRLRPALSIPLHVLMSLRRVLHAATPVYRSGPAGELLKPVPRALIRILVTLKIEAERGRFGQNWGARSGKS